ncbi:ZIP family metal transporter [Mycoplasmopsis hyopharyngis]|uniref:ZIP family metal transporter n=1 Tax=Mycoplasmopsis hyopharyngis TaxID=29558 RepID=UPI003873AC2C
MEKIIDFFKIISPENQPWNDIVAKLLLSLASMFLLFFIPLIFVLVVPIFKDKLSKKSTYFLYAFMSGFFLTMALFGFLKESLEISSLSAQGKGYSLNKIYGWNILLIGGGLILGLGLAIGTHFLTTKVIQPKLSKKSNSLIHNHLSDEHCHEIEKASTNELVENKKEKDYSKLIAIILLLTHRIPEGFLIGVSLNALYNGNAGNMNLAFFISFILHLIPEELLFYYRQREMGVSKKKAIGISIGLLFLFVAPILLGLYSGTSIQNFWQIAAFIEAFIAGIFIFTSIFEFIPEFAFEKHDSKTKQLLLLFIILGIVLAAIILSIHSHGNGTLFGSLGITIKFK